MLRDDSTNLRRLWRSSLAQLKALVFLQEVFKGGPAIFVQRLESVQIHLHHGRVVLFKEGVDRAAQIFFCRSGREIFNRAVFVMSDAERIQEVTQNLAMGADQPDLKEMCGDRVVRFLAERVLQPGEALLTRLLLDEHRAELPLLCQRVDCRLVERLLFFVQKPEELGRSGLRHVGENLVWLIHRGTMRAGRVGEEKGDASCCLFLRLHEDLGGRAFRGDIPTMTAPAVTNPVPIKSLTLEDLQARLVALNQPGYRAKQVMQWLYGKRVGSFEQMSDLPAALRQQLAAEFHFDKLELIRTLGSADTTRKFLFRLADGNLIESVLIPASPALYGEASDRRTLCISTQVGCAYGCKFCASGLDGWTRNLHAGEIVDQVLRAEEISGERVSNLVFMGMGEPLANFANLMKAITIINSPWGIGIGARHITISTSGLAPQIRQLADQPLQLRLAISLHGATDEVRQQIMPVNRKYPLAELLDACVYYTQHKKQWLTFEYILIEGINDRPEDARALVKVARKVKAKVNCIPYNTVEGLAWKRPSEERQDAFMEILHGADVTATLRREKGHDIAAACGQLRRQSMPVTTDATAG